MKRHLLILAIMLGTVNLMAQTPTVANLSATGTGIQWYAAPTGGIPLATSTILVNGTKYYASQTINGVESTARFEVTANLINQAAPTTGTHTPSQTQVVWNWNTVTGAAGYKWNTVNTYSSATDMGTAVTQTETGLTCNTAYTRYLWAYNGSGCVSAATILTQTSSTCIPSPQNFSFTGTMQTMTIPTGTTQVTIMVWGAQGASSYNPGGKGGYATGTLAVTPGQTITIVVGGQPTFNNTAGYHTGGWPDGGQGWYNGQSGGGSSYVIYGGTKVIIAGGGGGANVFNDTPGAGGDTNGGNASSGGGGGTQLGGGTANSVNAAAGSLGQGGYAGQSNNNGGGGGGGYYGGGGAENGVGGGGSGYIGGVSSSSMQTGIQSGNGAVQISW